MNINYLVKEGVAADSYWDMALLKDLISDIPEGGDREIFLIPGAYQGDMIDEVNKELAKYPKVLVFVTSDEEGKFDCEKLIHPDMIHYRQYGYCKNLFPIGYTSETRKHLKSVGLVTKDIDTFFAGQLNSDERRNVFSRIASIPRSVLYATDGFSKGMAPETYYDYMAHAKYAPAPGGHVSPDSFRFYEALEAGAIPTFVPDYLKRIFPDMPVHKEGWDDFTNSEMFAWWIRTKLKLKQQIRKDLNINLAMTVVIPTSPIPSHPDTRIIAETIASIRKHTAMDIIITIDGVRPEQEHMRAAYEQYIKQLLWKCNYEWENVMPILFKEHVHQSGMMKEALNHVVTPLVMYVEHDTPLVTDEDIDWGIISKTLIEGSLHVVRFHYEAHVPKEHEYLMLPEHSQGKFLATKQWSQRPHIARTEFYRNIMNFFSAESNCFIEDRVYTKCVSGEWKDWRVAIYMPGENIKRSLNLDGRAGDTKFEGRQIW